MSASQTTSLQTNQVIETSGIAFGTSGARGLVTQFSSNACAAFTHAFISVAKQSFTFDSIAFAIDNRPSSYAMAQACAAAAQQQGIKVNYYGVIPTPALAYQAMQDKQPSIMITGSHIPFDRNGLKFYRPDGEISKSDETAIKNAEVAFSAIEQLPDLQIDDRAANSYLDRYLSLFSAPILAGKRLGIYEHSSAGRDLYSQLFSQLGAEVISLGRSNEFVPIDTEAVSDEDVARAKHWVTEHQLDFLFSTDGDGDRPLIAGENGEWLRGDILGLICSAQLKVEALAVPVSCNTAIEASQLFNTISRTKIGSPYVIAEFAELAKQYQTIAGFEANGGYLLGSDIKLNNQTLTALPTRDAVLPALMLMMASTKQGVKSVVNALPKRYTASDRIKNFATEKSQAIITDGLKQPDALIHCLGFGEIQIKNINSTDGLRMTLSDGNIVHLRPSGNAPELRCYAEANDVITAQNLVNKTLTAIQTL
ncbi:phosphomannomutase [Saccharobesus litoralis]|uniref:Phosphomannomutase n=1 Tax=Saccharobesus litoralis TaxID=2172099 RepID=A0A2S0VRF0_9ALTE|nr:phosphomannomutase [Saccharobesus litoralis]AWB66762.1 phosphomannomutase [Saccharobesus litoralis]